MTNGSYNLHWDATVPREGLGENLKRIQRASFAVKDVDKSIEFYTNIINLKVTYRSESFCILNANNTELELKIGTPNIFGGENLIVSHVSIDVQDHQAAFQYLTDMKVPFEINVSVPKGDGKAESEGGSKDNTVGQAFLRDPDGYYIEICNCHVLTDFVLGSLTDDSILDNYVEGAKATNIMRSMIQFKMKAKRSSMNLIKRRSSTEITEIVSESDRPKEADITILANFVKRRDVYGDICQSFTPNELERILIEAGNHAGTAILLMKQQIESGKVTKIYQPPAYYVGEVDSKNKFKPSTLTAGAEEKGKTLSSAPKFSTGVAKLLSSKSILSQEEKKEADEPNSPVNFSITSVNHIALIVSDVGRSSVFYSDVLGLQQVKRPNFDRHGAWFTGGNIEIHLILGNPVPPSRSIKGIEASTIWFEVDDFEKAKNELKILEAAYGEDIQIEVDDDIITFRDDDGYVFGFQRKREDTI